MLLSVFFGGVLAFISSAFIYKIAINIRKYKFLLIVKNFVLIVFLVLLFYFFELHVVSFLISFTLCFVLFILLFVYKIKKQSKEKICNK